jgi:CysZ protein
MWLARSSSLFSPIARGLSQLDDPVFLGVVARSVAISIACFAALHVLTIWMVHRLLGLHGPLAWAIDILGSVGASFLALWLFLPVAAVIGTFYFDRIAFAVEHRFYPGLPPPRGAPAVEQIWDGIAVGLRVLALNALALVLALLIPGIGLFLGWMIAGFAIGRGLFVAVAMRRMPRAVAESLYRARRGVVLVQGAVLALAAYVPLLNLLIPVIGTAAMVHILDEALSSGESGEGIAARRRWMLQEFTDTHRNG